MKKSPFYRLRQASQAGQTLIMLMIFMLLIVTITGAAATITIVNTQATSGYAKGETALQLAESGVENGILRLERDPNYAGETVTTTAGTATITISGTLPTKTVTAVGTVGDFHRTVVANASYANNIWTITSWSETP